MKIAGTIEVSEADYRKQRKAYEAMLAALKAAHAWLLDDTTSDASEIGPQIVAAINLAEGDR